MPKWLSMAATARATWLCADARCVHLARALLFSGLSFRLSVSLHQQKAGYKELEAGECHLISFVETNKKLFFSYSFCILYVAVFYVLGLMKRKAVNWRLPTNGNRRDDR